jgi:hypothetical protein
MEYSGVQSEYSRSTSRVRSEYSWGQGEKSETPVLPEYNGVQAEYNGVQAEYNGVPESRFFPLGGTTGEFFEKNKSR